MKIKVKYFASLKALLGRSEDSFNLTQNTTVADLWQQVSADRDLPDTIMTAVNLEYVTAEKILEEGDEVAFFPPVTGG